MSPSRCPLLPGAHHVATQAFDLLQGVAAEATGLGAVVGVFGESGVGKTHAVAYYVEHAGVPHAYVTASPRPSPKEIFEELLCQTTGTVGRGSTRQLRRQCLEALAEKPWIVVVDEAQFLSSMWLQQLRHLHDDPEARWTLVLVGGMGCARKLKKSPELWSRIAYRVTFEPLENGGLLKALNAYHPVFAATDDDLLLEIDKRVCHGRLRAWLQLLQAALPLLGRTTSPDRLSKKVVRAAFAKMGTT